MIFNATCTCHVCLQCVLIANQPSYTYHVCLHSYIQRVYFQCVLSFVLIMLLIITNNIFNSPILANELTKR